MFYPYLKQNFCSPDSVLGQMSRWNNFLMGLFQIYAINIDEEKQFKYSQLTCFSKPKKRFDGYLLVKLFHFQLQIMTYTHKQQLKR